MFFCIRYEERKIEAQECYDVVVVHPNGQSNNFMMDNITQLGKLGRLHLAQGDLLSAFQALTSLGFSLYAVLGISFPHLVELALQQMVSQLGSMQAVTPVQQPNPTAAKFRPIRPKPAQVVVPPPIAAHASVAQVANLNVGPNAKVTIAKEEVALPSDSRSHVEGMLMLDDGQMAAVEAFIGKDVLQKCQEDLVKQSILVNQSGFWGRNDPQSQPRVSFGLARQIAR